MRGLLACCLVLAVACTPATKPTFDISTVKASPEGDAPTLTGWLQIEGRSFRLYPSTTKPAANAPCLSGVLLSLAGVPTDDMSDRLMSVSGFILDKDDPSAEGAANPCQSDVIITAIEIGYPEPLASRT